MLTGLVVLVVDDEPDLRDILKDEMSMLGATVLESASGNEALQVVQKNKIDLILTDVRMPNGDGVALLKAVKSIDTHSPIVIMLTGDSYITSDEIFSLGAAALFMKPFDLDMIGVVAQKLLNEGEQRWSVSTEGKKTVVLSSQSLDDAFSQGEMSLGQGGVFIKNRGELYRVEDTVTCVLRTGAIEQRLFTGIVRWVRCELTSQQTPGVGIEFTWVSPDVLASLKARTEFRSGIAYIPN